MPREFSRIDRIGDQMQRELAVVDQNLQQIAERSRAGESTPVLVSHVDALGLRTRLEELALARFP